jgi:hypothetical protein
MPAGGYHENARQRGSRESLHLLELVEEHGNKWHEIGQRLGRTPASARNRHVKDGGSSNTSRVQYLEGDLFGLLNQQCPASSYARGV